MARTNFAYEVIYCITTNLITAPPGKVIPYRQLYANVPPESGAFCASVIRNGKEMFCFNILKGR